MTSPQDWRIRPSALTIIILVTATMYLGAQEEHARKTQAAVGSSIPHSANRSPSEQEDAEIGWTQLRAELETELIVGGNAQATLKISRVPDGPRKSVLSVEVLGKTVAKHGLLRLSWDQRTTRRIELFELSTERYLVVKAEEYVEVKAPYGDWRLQNEQSRDYVRTPIAGQVITGRIP